MKKDYTHITVILDRTGSMEPIRDDTIGGFNTFLKSQKEEPGEATLTLVQFDTQDSYEVIHRFKPIAEVPELTRETFVPRASTPLLDALGRGINDLEKSICDLKKDDRPSKVVIVVVTDGEENSSVEFRKEQIERMIKSKTELNDWQFVFLSADLSAIGNARSVGIVSESVMFFSKNTKGSNAAWGAAGDRMSDFRANRMDKIVFGEEDRKNADELGEGK